MTAVRERASSLSTSLHFLSQAALLSAEVGFDALYFARIDWQEAKVRTKDKSMEMVWRASASLGAHAEVFTGAFLDGGYGPPPGFDFDGPPAPARGVPARARAEAGRARRNAGDGRRVPGGRELGGVRGAFRGGSPAVRGERARGGRDQECASPPSYRAPYRTPYRSLNLRLNQVMFLMGSDFQYENADAWCARAARPRPRAVMVAVRENLRKEQQRLAGGGVRRNTKSNMLS